jgi:hypothetical protein
VGRFDGQTARVSVADGGRYELLISKKYSPTVAHVFSWWEIEPGVCVIMGVIAWRERSLIGDQLQCLGLPNSHKLPALLITASANYGFLCSTFQSGLSCS